MPSKLITQLEQVSRHRWWQRGLVATCYALAAVSLVALVAMGIDWTLAIVDLIGRCLLTALFAALVGLIARHWFCAVSQHRLPPLQIALAVERQHPQLRDLVTSAWDFGQQAGKDPTAGSASLRRAVVLHAATAVDEVDWQRLVPRQPLRKAMLALAGVGLTISLLSWTLPQVMRIGLTRLVNPLSNAEWPREYDLQFVGPPALLATGEDLVLQLRDKQRALPPLITMHYRTRRQGSWHEETQLLAATSDPLEIHRPNVEASLQYRASGGDHHSMPWQTLKVVAPPGVESWQLIMHPPAYTKLPAQPWDKESPIYVGSDLELQGRTDRPVTQVSLGSQGGKQLVAQVGHEGRDFRVEPSAWQITESDCWSLQLTTLQGLKTAAAIELELEVTVDQPPQVRFVEPANDLTVLPTVAVPLVIEASDELALRDVELLVRRSDRAGADDQRLRLWQATDDAVEGRGARQQRVEFLWQLEPLSLEPGSVVEVRALASDYRPLGDPPWAGQPATGQTVRPLRLVVVSEEALWRQIVQRQTHLVETLSQLLRSQRALRAITADWSELPAWSQARWANASHAALFGQRKIAAALASGQQSVIGQLAELRQSIERNQLLRQETASRLQTAQESLQSLVDHPLAAVDEALSKVARRSQRALDRDKLRGLFAETAGLQEQVIDGLRSVIELLMPANVLGQIESELSAILTDQAALAEHCRVEIAPQVLQAENAQTEEPAALAAAVHRQQDLSRRFAQCMLELSQAAERMAVDEPTLAAHLADTATFAKQLGVQPALQAAADQLARRRVGRSSSLQQQALDDLAKLLTRLAGQDAAGTAERFEHLQLAERELQELRRQVDVLQEELHQLTSQHDQRELERLGRQREQLAQQTAGLTRQLQRWRMPSAAEATGKATSHLDRPTLDNKTVQQAQEQLDIAQQQVTTQRRRQQVTLARLQMAQLLAKLSSMVDSQQAIKQEINRLEGSPEQASQLSASQQQSVVQLADRQADLQREVTVQADQLTSLPVFAHLLNMAGETMQRVEAGLLQTKLGPNTQALAEQAVGQLTRLAEAVRQKSDELSENHRNESRQKEGEKGRSRDTAQEQTLQLALGQLKLLKLLQTELQQKTRILERQQAADQPTTESASELARQQRQLTELTRQLTAESADLTADQHFPNAEQESTEPRDRLSLPRSN